MTKLALNSKAYDFVDDFLTSRGMCVDLLQGPGEGTWFCSRAPWARWTPGNPAGSSKHLTNRHCVPNSIHFYPAISWHPSENLLLPITLDETLDPELCANRT